MIYGYHPAVFAMPGSSQPNLNPCHHRSCNTSNTTLVYVSFGLKVLVAYERAYFSQYTTTVDSGVFQLATRFPIYLPDSVRQSNGEVENKPQGDNVPSMVPPTYFKKYIYFIFNKRCYHFFCKSVL